MAAKKWRRVTLSFDRDQDMSIARLRKKIFPYAPESIGIREILLQLASDCGNALQSVAELHGYKLIPLDQWEAMSRTRANSEGSYEREEKKKEKEGGVGGEKTDEETRLAPLPISQEVIGYLNELTGGNQRPTAKSHRRLIQARLNDGNTVADIKEVIRKKCKEWVGTKMAGNLKPSCLFRASNFDNYIGQAEPIRPKPGQSDLFKGDGRHKKHIQRMAEAQRDGDWSKSWEDVIK